MKYRFCRGVRRSSPHKHPHARLRGKTTLRRLNPSDFYRLTDPEPFLEPREHTSAKRRGTYTARLSALLLRLTSRKDRSDPHKTIPVLAGALSGALSVTLAVALVSALLLSAPYRRSYTAVTIPDFEGKDPFSVLGEDAPFNLILRYEINPGVPAGLVISQSPPAGVRRRIGSENQRCDIILTVSKSEEPYTLPSLEGTSARDAELLLRNHGFTVRLEKEYSHKETGMVLGSLPAAGTLLSAKDTVTLRVSLGKKPMRAYVPDLTGLSESEALSRLSGAGLRVGNVRYRTSPLPAGTVIEQDCAAYTMADAYTPIDFSVSLGERYAIRSLPDLYGMSEEDAAAVLRAYGLTVTRRHSLQNRAPTGTVITQSPLPGTPITAETFGVELYVSASSDE